MFLSIRTNSRSSGFCRETFILLLGSWDSSRSARAIPQLLRHFLTTSFQPTRRQSSRKKGSNRINDGKAADCADDADESASSAQSAAKLKLQSQTKLKLSRVTSRCRDLANLRIDRSARAVGLNIPVQEYVAV